MTNPAYAIVSQKAVEECEAAGATLAVSLWALALTS